MKLVLVRHGQTLFNKLEYVQGWCDSPLTELGIQQAQSACEAIKDLHIDVAYSSISERAYDTACIVLGNRNLEVIRDKRLKELNFGLLEGNSNFLKSQMNHLYTDIANGNRMYCDYTSIKGENTNQLLERYCDILDELESKYKDKTVFIAAHGYSLTVFIKYLTKVTDDEFRFMKNAQVALLEGEGRNYKLVELRNPSKNEM